MAFVAHGRVGGGGLLVYGPSQHCLDKIAVCYSEMAHSVME